MFEINHLKKLQVEKKIPFTKYEIYCKTILNIIQTYNHNIDETFRQNKT